MTTINGTSMRTTQLRFSQSTHTLIRNLEAHLFLNLIRSWHITGNILQ